MESRTFNAKRNIMYSAISQIVNIIVKFGMRTVFIYCLGKEYLGISGVFTNVLNVLNLTELGIGVSITYDMYKPIADNDEAMIGKLVDFYKKIYLIIGVTILAIGTLLIPFLPNIITDVPNVPHVTFIYILFLIQSVSTYFYAQYSSLLNAHQRNYVITKYNLIFSIIKAIVESILLIVTWNYIVYLIVDILLSVLCNFIIYKHAIYLFPYIKNRSDKLPIEKRNKIIKNAFSNFSLKLGSTVVVSTDNILISSLISTVVVGIYSNYSLITNVILTGSMILRNSLTAGVGNVCAIDGNEKKFEVFKNIYFAFAVMYSIVFSCLLTCTQSFIQLWAGKDYLIPMSTLLLVIINCYTQGMKQPIEMYIDTDGLFKNFKVMPWIGAGLNLLISYFLALRIGLIGIFLGTLLSFIAVSFWYEGYIVFKCSFEKKIINYFKITLSYYLMTAFCSLLAYGCCIKLGLIQQGFFKLVLSGMISIVVVLATYTFAFNKTDEYKFWKSFILNILHRS